MESITKLALTQNALDRLTEVVTKPILCYVEYRTMGIKVNPAMAIASNVTDSEQTELQQAIKKAASILMEAGANAVYIFGSAVEGEIRPDSDIDLAVTGLPTSKFFEVMGRAMIVLPRPLDLVDLDADTPFTRYLIRKGKLHRVA